MERATRYGLCVPVTTIGIAPILIRGPTGDASTNLPASVPQSDLPEPSARPRTNRQVRIIQLQLDISLGCDAMGRSVDKGDATENSRPRSKTCSKALMKLQTKPTGGSP